jgi:phage gp36-like protein
VDYATTDDLANLGVAAEALSSIAEAQQEAVITARSRFCDGYLNAQYTLPLTAITGDLTWAVCQLACYDLVSNHGYTTDKDNQDNLRKRHDDAIKWLEMVRDGEITPPLTDSGSSADDGGADLVSATNRGWSNRSNTSTSRRVFQGD